MIVILILLTLEQHLIIVLKIMGVVGKGMRLVICGIIFIIKWPKYPYKVVDKRQKTLCFFKKKKKGNLLLKQWGLVKKL